METIRYLHQRREYEQDSLLEEEAGLNPFVLFKRWFEESLEAGVPHANAMTLATVSSEGKPSARIVLFKDFGENGFTFFTDYRSTKSEELSGNPHGALVCLWSSLERQIRIEGKTERTSPEVSDTYFQSRPRGAQLAAWTSHQSQVVANREVLEVRMNDLDRRYKDQPIPRPPHWGGYRLIAQMIEFWQGRPNRLNDRLRYQLSGHGSWTRQRLSP